MKASATGSPNPPPFRSRNIRVAIMSASQFCDHRNLALRSPGGEQFLDSNIRMIQVRVVCLGCGRGFRAVGVHPGLSIDGPSTMDDGATIMMPIVPVGEEPDMDTRAMLS